MNAVFEQCVTTAQGGDLAGAQRTMDAAMEKIRAASGPEHPIYAAALFQQSSWFAFLNEWEKAADACHMAAQIEGRDEQSRKDRLTYGMNEAEFLQMAGKHAEALAVMRENVKQREAFYGKAHSGYSYGLAELASALLRNKDQEGALAAATEAVAIDFERENPHVAVCVAIQGLAAVAAGKADSAFENWPALSAEWRHGVVDTLRATYRKHEPATLIGTLERLTARIAEQPGSEPRDFRSLLVLTMNVARDAGLTAPRVKAARALAACKDAGPDERTEYLKALAIALGDAGLHDEEMQTYAVAIADCRKRKSANGEANCLREKALALGNCGRSAEAAPAHDEAVASARSCGDSVILARALMGKGIFLHHEKKPAEALPLLEEAAKLLPAGHKDLYYVLNHLIPAREGAACRCDVQGPSTICLLLKARLEKVMGPGIIGEVVATDDEEDPWTLHLTRKPTEEESRKLSDAWINIYDTLRKELLGEGTPVKVDQ